MERQDLRNQKGEVEFRRLLVRQQVQGADIFADEISADEMIRVLEQRMTVTAGHLRELRNRGVTLSPYVEIGAERGQRSLVMENDLGAHGAAADLSFDMLGSAAHWATAFQRPRLPLRVCCDVYNLPFRSESLPFVFCYETLHHFPDPSPVLDEVRRVLGPGGWFFFEEEPFRRALRQKLFRTRKAADPRAGKVARLLHTLLHYVSEPDYNEVKYGILENHSIPIAKWRSALDGFEQRMRAALRFLAPKPHVRVGTTVTASS